MKKKVSLLLAALLILTALTGCGGKMEESAPAASAPAMEAPVAPMGDGYYGADMDFAQTESTTGGSVISGQKLIRTASLELETTEFEATVQDLDRLVREMGGYMESSSLRNRASGYRYANYVIRIPAEEYDAFLAQAGELCHETWRSTSQEDISEMYYDTQGRLKTQQIKLERLQELLSRAESMEDIITIESAISQTEQQIDSLSGTLRHYDGKVDYATIDLSLSEVYQYSNTEQAPTTFTERMGNAFSGGWRNFTDSMEDLAVSFAYSWMWWLIFGAAGAVIIRTVSKKGAKLPRLRRKKKMGDNNGEN